MPVITIGRVSEMDIVIDNISVSRHQAELRKEAGSWVVLDMGSAYLERVVRTAVAHSDTAESDGDVLTFANLDRAAFQRIPALLRSAGSPRSRAS